MRVRPLPRALLALGLLFAAPPCAARLKHRVPAFEPTDLDLEDPHVVELDLQVGAVLRDQAPKTRIYVPDFELGLSRWPRPARALLAPRRGGGGVLARPG